MKNLFEMIINKVHTLPERQLKAVYEFMENLNPVVNNDEDSQWSEFSLTSAMRGMEDENSPYSENDLHKTFQ
jgi:hypothetical protein